MEEMISTNQIEELAALRRQGYRLTPQRLQVLQAIKVCGRHITAEEIHSSIVPYQPYIAITTVYRALKWLEDIGLIAGITIDGRLCYEYHAQGDHHHHLVCQQCGQQLQVPDSHLATLRADLHEAYGFVLAADHIALEGRCMGCTPIQEIDQADD